MRFFGLYAGQFCAVEEGLESVNDSESITLLLAKPFLPLRMEAILMQKNASILQQPIYHQTLLMAWK